mmetsp:Transcript_8337/g.11611  ORF Transcript_8337/g.11611 Transcript_8337/m.11611 type:complete len:217 (+) Transcript_8337:60-710(+)|eukprot:CAMPEP_0197288750 /NCGR_PEP_ID=MMETSP0890-20130614/5918_1 /TAXON_ID=44058 ORGANISM="Aureoumbra lagunensis, Strain CCMP1510" /NCGR_SAMPLE_ID=MMETSP0890 /ASSEMBLY_ACC=CAM_ASM_000533 /LENGTH=216 /DNA_ID=CAMNT_0042759713 /DNA_START=60 /DNA_END=710 /DNA_ORIENTATION=-
MSTQRVLLVSLVSAVGLALVPSSFIVSSPRRVNELRMSERPMEAGVATLSAEETEGLGADIMADISEVEDWEEEISGDEDLLAGFDLDSEDVGEISEWPIPRKMKIAAERDAIKQEYAVHENDVGSPPVQIALFSARIKHITEHVIENTKDHSSRRGLLALVSKRRRLLNYYYTQDPQGAEDLIQKLGIRFRFKSKLPSRAEKYRQYTIEANRKRK